MRLHRDTRTELQTIALLALFSLALGGCGRSYSTSSFEGSNTNTNTNPNTNTTPPPPPPPPPPPGPNCATNPNDPGCQTPAPTLTCTIALVSGAAVQSTPQAPQPPAQYLVSIQPAPTANFTPTITSTPSGAFVVGTVTPNVATTTVAGTFSVSGAVKIQASTTIGTSTAICSVDTQVSAAATPKVGVYRFDRMSPPDIFYTASATPAPTSPISGYNPTCMAGVTDCPMFYAWTQAPTTAECSNPAPLYQCLYTYTSPPYMQVHLLAQSSCNGLPQVSQVGTICLSQGSNPNTLYRFQRPVAYDGRFYETTDYSEFNRQGGLQSQGWVLSGTLGYTPAR